MPHDKHLRVQITVTSMFVVMVGIDYFAPHLDFVAMGLNSIATMVWLWE